jgi:mannosylglycoprotein endo-beta-mannosidase
LKLFLYIKDEYKIVSTVILKPCNALQIVNTTGNPLTGVSIKASVWELDGTCPFQTTFKQQLAPPHKTVKAFHLSYLDSISANSVYFVLLKLLKDINEQVSRNFYWLHKPGSDFSALEGDFKNTKVPVTVSAVSIQDGDLLRISAQLTNVSDQARLQNDLPCSEFFKRSRPGVAFWLHFSVLNKEQDGEDDKRILPVRYSNNFISLLPGEIADVQISFRIAKGVVPRVLLQGWNIDEVEVPYTP